jgi:hypothetical protein
MPSSARYRWTGGASADIWPTRPLDGSAGSGTDDQALSALLALRDIYRMADARRVRPERRVLEHRDASVTSAAHGLGRVNASSY